MWGFSGISMGFLWDFHGISVGFLWDFHGISMGFLCRISMGFHVMNHPMAGFTRRTG